MMMTFSTNAHSVIVLILMFSQTGTNVLSRRNAGSDKPNATIEHLKIMIPTRT